MENSESKRHSLSAEPNPYLLKSAREKARLLDTETYAGISYFRYHMDIPPGPDHFKTFFESIREAELQTDDVISFGYPRSGNHWAFEIITMVLTQSTEFAKVRFFERLIELMGSDVKEEVRSLVRPRVFTSHCYLDFLPKDIVDKKVKVIYVLRNPKDSMVSWYRLMTSKKEERSRFSGSWDEFFELQMLGELPWGAWHDHVLATERFLQDHPAVPFFVFNYEKVKADPVTSIRELCRFLGQPEVMASEIAAETSFENMRVGTKSNFDVEMKILPKEGESVNKQWIAGSVGNWRNVFSKSQSRRFDAVLSEKLPGSTLAQMIKDYVVW